MIRILLSPLIVGMLLIGATIYFFFIILSSPIERIKYKKSLSYKHSQKQYRLGVTKTNDFLLFEQLLKKTDTFRTIKIKDNYEYLTDENYVYLWMFYDDIDFDKALLTWKVVMKHVSKFVELDVFIEHFSHEMNEADRNKKIILMTQEDIFNAYGYQQALKDERFIIYKEMDDLADKLI